MKQIYHTKIKPFSQSPRSWLGLILCLAMVIVFKLDTAGVSAQSNSPISPISPPEPGEPVSGVILLQGRTNHAGSSVFLSEEACASLPQDPKLIPSDLPFTQTDAEGRFEIKPIADSMVYVCLQAVRHGYLAGQSNTLFGQLGTLQLPGGDVIEDNVINIFDLAFIAGRYQTGNAEADINADGQVDIFDLAITAGNYNVTGPISNWE